VVNLYATKQSRQKMNVPKLKLSHVVLFLFFPDEGKKTTEPILWLQ